MAEFDGGDQGFVMVLKMKKYCELQGTDITEAFESYHIRNIAEKVLSNYYVREAKKPRNYKFTFDEDGFYRTLKRRAAKRLKILDRSSLWKSKMILDLVVVFMFLTAILATRADTPNMSLMWGFVAAQLMAWVNTLSHNFIHQRDNWRSGECTRQAWC